MTPPDQQLSLVTDELAKYPSAVLDEFRSAHSQLQVGLVQED